jgi:hypothetical protein
VLGEVACWAVRLHLNKWCEHFYLTTIVFDAKCGAMLLKHGAYPKPTCRQSNA